MLSVEKSRERVDRVQNGPVEPSTKRFETLHCSPTLRSAERFKA